MLTFNRSVMLSAAKDLSYSVAAKQTFLLATELYFSSQTLCTNNSFALQFIRTAYFFGAFRYTPFIFVAQGGRRLASPAAL
jgi:hypothetical protein